VPNTEIQCPVCGSFATRPRATNSWQSDKLYWSDVVGSFGFGKMQVAFDNPKWVQSFRSGRVAAVCDSCKYEFDVNTPQRKTGAVNVAAEKRSAAERMKALVELRAAGLITEDEFQRKRDDILRGL
jgi:hypothetical protein